MNARAAGRAGNVERRTIRMNVRIPSEFFARGAGLRRRQKAGIHERVAQKHRRSARASTSLGKAPTLPPETEMMKSKRLPASVGVRVGCAQPGVMVDRARRFWRPE